MTRRHPPRLALAVLERLVPDSAPLAGDLIEEFEGGRSRGWLWWQVVAAIAVARLGRPDVEIRPLRLVDRQPADALERSRRMSLRFRPVNLTASPVHGIGGLGMVVLCVLVSRVVPAAWWLLLASVFSGVLLGIAMIAMRRCRAV